MYNFDFYTHPGLIESSVLHTLFQMEFERLEEGHRDELLLLKTKVYNSNCVF